MEDRELRLQRAVAKAWFDTGDTERSPFIFERTKLIHHQTPLPQPSHLVQPDFLEPEAPFASHTSILRDDTGTPLSPPPGPYNLDHGHNPATYNRTPPPSSSTWYLITLLMS